MRRIALVVAGATATVFLLAACGGGSKPESQVLEERAFKAHSEYLLAEAEVLNYWSKDAGATSRRHLDVRAQKLFKECEEAITEQECSVQEPLEKVVHEIDARTHQPSS